MASCIGSAICKPQLAATEVVAMAAGTTASSSHIRSAGEGFFVRVSPSGLAKLKLSLPVVRRTTQRSRPVTICMAEGDNVSESSSSTSEGSVSSSSTTPPTSSSSLSAAAPPLAAPVKPKRRPEGFGDLMAFSGPAPELINGRLAMLGFVAGLVAERATGLTFLQQFQASEGSIIGAAVVFAVASLIPKFVSGTPLGDLLKEANKDKSTTGVLKPFNADVERLHGRLAMLGFMATLIIEASNGGSGIFTA